MTPSRSNGAVLTTPLALKHDAPLWLDKEPLPEYSSTLPEYAKLNSQEYARINSEYNSLDPSRSEYSNQSQTPKEYSRPERAAHTRSNRDSEYSRNNLNLSDLPGSHASPQMRRSQKDINNLYIQEYASPGMRQDVARGTTPLADYAEVDSAMAAKVKEINSPAPYATTTLVTSNRKHGNSLNVLHGWIPKNKRTPSPEEPVYPASNGGYYNRNVYSDSYFAPTYTLRRGKRDRKPNEPPPDIVSPGQPGQPVYARVGPPVNSWKGGSPQLSSFIPSKQLYHASTKSEPGAQL